MDFAVASTLHDQGFGLARMLSLWQARLVSLFPKMAVCLTTATPESAALAFGTMARVSRGTIREHASTYAQALREALAFGTEYVLAVDFDRLLHWVANYPAELEGLPSRLAGHDFAIIGRTARALATHPAMQQLTERTVNAAASLVLGQERGKERDVICGTWWLERGVAEELLGRGRHDRLGFYAEWPLLCWKLAINPAYIEAEGLEWETPDRFQDDISSMGYDAWLKALQAKQWSFRAELAECCVREIVALAKDAKDF